MKHWYFRMGAALLAMVRVLSFAAPAVLAWSNFRCFSKNIPRRRGIAQI